GEKKKLNIKWIDSERSFIANDLEHELAGIDGILIPGGFGVRGIEGKIAIAQYARERNIPLLGICLGMQVMAIEGVRNIGKLNDANSTEFDEMNPNPVIHLMEDQRYIDFVGASMRLGAYQCKLAEGSLARRAYGVDVISERHRHRYEFNNTYRDSMREAGFNLSGVSLNDLLVEVIEYPKNDFYIGVQYHPEFKSRPNRPHPLFTELIRAAAKQ
nr:gamma-glutamyl-gamma-aminobutyrate hydrolase family protein [Candidatus Cloacimonadota bacterium]